jgi:hypothetical protein
VTSGDLFSIERLTTIMNFQLGAYEPSRQRYIQRQKDELEEE